MIMRSIIFVLMSFLLLSACTTVVQEGESANPAATFTNTVWILQQLSGQTVAVDDARRMPRVIFLDDNRVNGFGGCNAFSGRYGTVSGQFRFLEMAATQESCANKDLEDRFFAAMKATRALELKARQLLLQDAAGVTDARFGAVEKK